MPIKSKVKQTIENNNSYYSVEVLLYANNRIMNSFIFQLINSLIFIVVCYLTQVLKLTICK